MLSFRNSRVFTRSKSRNMLPQIKTKEMRKAVLRLRQIGFTERKKSAEGTKTNIIIMTEQPQCTRGKG